MLLLKTSKSNLLGPLQVVSGVVEKKHTLPILSNVLIEGKAGIVTLLATDIEIQVTTHTADGDCESEFAFTVAAKKFQDILRALADDADVALTLDDRKLQVKAGKSKFSLQTLPASDYPRMNISTPAAAFTLTQGQLKSLLAMVQYSMAVQDIRYYLNGLLLVADGNELKVIATDGHRLAYTSMSVPGDLPHTEIILPRKTVLELSRLLSDTDEPIEIQLSPTQATFRFASIELVSKLIDGKFPDYRRVIPLDHDKCISIGRIPLLQALQRASILTSDKFRGVRLVLTSGSLRIISTNAEQEEAVEELEVPYQGDALDVGFNAGYLVDVLNNSSVEHIECRLRDANSSALITLPGNSEFKYVVMPMRI